APGEQRGLAVAEGRSGDRAATAEHRDAVQVLLPAERGGDDDVPDLVVRSAQALLGQQHAASALRTLEDADDRLFELLLVDLRAVLTDRQQRGLVDDRREVGAGEARATVGEASQVHVRRERLAARVD